MKYYKKHMGREPDTCIRIAGGLVGGSSVLCCSFGAFPFMQAGCKPLLNQSGMIHILLVLVFTYVNDNSKLRTDQLDPHTMYIFPSAARTTAMHYYALQ